MKQCRGWWIPELDNQILDAVETEWNEKYQTALALCTYKQLVVCAGANIGLFPIRLAQYFEQVVTFEPFKDNITCCKKNIDQSGVTNIRLNEVGLGEKEDKVGIIFSLPTNCGAVQLGGEGEIEVKPLDSYNLPALDLLWLDIEGYEWKALLGGKQTIAKFKPIIILENKGLIPEMGGDLNGSDALRNKMKELGYKQHTRIMRDDFYVPL